MKLSILLIALVLTYTANAQPSQSSNDLAKKQIGNVIETFGKAIINKDKDSFVKLFLHDNITWQRVASDEGLLSVRQTQPDAAKVRFDPKNSHLAFIDGIVASKSRVEEKFWNVRIETDGDVASVYSDYSFHVGDREKNHGKEAWHLVNTGTGWKIVSVIWSVIPSQQPEKKP